MVRLSCAAITSAKLPDDAAEDSFNISPALLGTDEGKPICPYTLHQTPSLAMAIRRGEWKYLDHKGSGGNKYPKQGLKDNVVENAPDAPGQLYNLETDPGETKNLYYECPEIVKELQGLLEKSKQSGRSRN